MKKYVFDETYVSSPNKIPPVSMARFSWSNSLNERGFSEPEPIKNTELYDYLKIPAFNYSGIMTLRIEGDVKVDASVKEAYLPIKAEQKLWRCSSNNNPSVIGTYLNGCHDLKEYYWASTGDLPKYSLSDPEINAELAKHYSADGLGGNIRCSVTRETGRKDLIGEDVVPNHLNKFINTIHENGALNYPSKPKGAIDPIYSAGNAFAQLVNDWDRFDATSGGDYSIAGYGVDEDGCDQAAIKLIWCPDEEETPPPVPVTETIVTTTRETETVTETPPVVTTTLPPSTVVTTVTPDPVTVTETPKTETTTATSEVTTTVTSTPPTKTTTLPPVTETVVTTEIPEPQTSTITSTEKVPTTVTQTPEKETVTTSVTPPTVTVPPVTKTEITTSTEKVPTTVTHTPEKETVTTSVTPPTVTAPPVTKTEITTSTEKVPTTVTHTPEKETVTTSVTPPTVTKNIPTTVVTQETITETKEIPTTVVSTEPGGIITVTETPVPVTSTVVAETPTVTESAPSTVVENGTAVVHLPEETVTVTPEPETPQQTPVQRVLASTGASVLGLLGVGAGIVAVGVFLFRRKN